MNISGRASIFLVLVVIPVVIGVVCHRAEYQIGQECCPMCPAGTRVNKHCSEFRSTSCQPCDEGTFMDEPTGMTKCISCRICASGSGMKVKTSCSRTSNAVCEPQDGFFCTEPLKDGNCEKSHKHKNCSPGEYVAQKGSASADAVCSPCPEGTFSNGTQCQPHTQCEVLDKDTVKPGTSSSDAECGQKKDFPLGLVIGVTVGLFLFGLVTIPVILYMKMKKNPIRGVV